MVQDSIQSGIFEHGNKRSGSEKSRALLAQRQKGGKNKNCKAATDRKKERRMSNIRFFMSS
jgi:hypothetical protein